MNSTDGQVIVKQVKRVQRNWTQSETTIPQNTKDNDTEVQLIRKKYVTD